MRNRSRALWRALPLILASLVGALSLPAKEANLEKVVAEARRRVISDVSYKLSFEFQKKSLTYLGDVQIHFRLSSVPEFLHLDFQGEEILETWVGKEPLAKGFPYENHRIQVSREHLKKGENSIRIRFRNEFDKDGSGLHRILDPEDGNEYYYTDFEPYDANKLFPCFDQPDLKASYKLDVLAPRDWKVIANGRQRSQVGEGDRDRHDFVKTERFSTYIFAMCVGPFASWTDPKAEIPSRVFCTQSQAKYMDAHRIFDVTRKGFRFFQKYFEIPYPFHKYDQIFLPQFNSGAMENVACVTFNGNYLYRHVPTERELERRANTILHEMAHMWFGDIVTMKWWNDLWLNESFATYMAHLALVEATGYKRAWESFDNGTKRWALWQDQLPTTHPIETPVPDTDTTLTNFDGITYGKGASVLRQLAFFVGPEAFRKGVSSYLKKFRWKNAERKDFIAEISKAAKRDLDGWTKDWLQTSGVNVIRPEIEVKGGKIRKFTLVQEKGNGDQELRPHRLNVDLYRGKKKLKLDRSITVEVKGARTEIPSLRGKKAPTFVRVNAGGHGYAKVFLDDDSFAFAQENLERLSPRLRSFVWSSSGQMVRDGAMDPKAYGELFLAKAALEKDPRVFQDFGPRILSVFNAYLPDFLRNAFVSRVQGLAWETLPKVEGDLKKAWFDIFRASAEDPAAQDRLLKVFEGELPLKDFDLDQTKRWAIVQHLCKMGHRSSQRLLEAEKARDPSERGMQTALGARALIPDATNKAEIWDKILTDKTSPLAHLRSAMNSFFTRKGREVARPYVAKYFELLPEIVKTRDQSFLRSFASGLYPGRAYYEAEILEDAQKILDRKDIPYPLRRSLIESGDELERALRVRKIWGPKK